MQLTENTDSKAGGALLRHAIALTGGAILVMSNGLARGDERSVVVTDGRMAADSQWLSATSEREPGDNRMDLRFSLTLDRLRNASRGRAPVSAGPLADHPAVGVEMPRLRLQTTFAEKVAPASAWLTLAQPVGELSRAGIVGASRLRFRDDAIFLEGDDMGRKEAAQGIDVPAAVPRPE